MTKENAIKRKRKNEKNASDEKKSVHLVRTKKMKKLQVKKAAVTRMAKLAALWTRHVKAVPKVDAETEDAADQGC